MLIGSRAAPSTQLTLPRFPSVSRGRLSRLVPSREGSILYVVLWQSWIEIEHCSASVTNELAVLIKDLGLPPHRARVSVLFITSTSSDAYESGFTLGHYIEYAPGTVNTW